MYECLTGKVPFTGSTHPITLYQVVNQTPASVSRVNSDVPVWLSGIVMKQLAKNPQHLYQSGSEAALIVGSLVWWGVVGRGSGSSEVITEEIIAEAEVDDRDMLAEEGRLGEAAEKPLITETPGSRPAEVQAPVREPAAVQTPQGRITLPEVRTATVTGIGTTLFQGTSQAMAVPG